MDIDLRTLLIVLIVIVGMIFLILVMYFPMFDSTSYDEAAETNDIEIASTSKHNIINNSSQTNSNTEIDSEISTDNENRIQEIENVEETIIEENVENEEVLESATKIALIEKKNTAPRYDFFGDENYVSRKIIYSRIVNYPCTLSYRIPESWASTGIKSNKLEDTAIRINIRSLSEFGNYNVYETTYEEFLNDYIKDQGKYNTYSTPDEFRIRNIKLANDEEYPILEEVGAYAVTNHMVFVFNENVISIEITLDYDKYNDENLKKIDNIFSSAYIFY